MTISERVLLLLKEQNKKQKELAEYAGIGSSSISEWKKRGTNPQAEAIPKIAEFLGVTTDYLLTGKDNILENKPKNEITEQKLISLGFSREKIEKFTNKDFVLIAAYLKGILDGKE